jgi:hypothetical protein
MLMERLSPGYSAGRVGVDRHVGAPVFGRLHGGAQLGDGVLCDIQRVVAGGHAAAGHQLDLRGAERQLLANPLAARRSVGIGWAEIFAILFPRTNTYEGGESVALLPSKTRTF